MHMYIKLLCKETYWIYILHLCACGVYMFMHICMWFMCIYTLVCVYMNRTYFLAWVSKASFSERKLLAKIPLSCPLRLLWKLKAHPTNVAKNPPTFHSQDVHLPEIIICTFSLFIYFLFFSHFFLDFSTHTLESSYYSTITFMALIPTQRWQFGYKHWKNNQGQRKRKLYKWEEVLQHLLWVSHSHCLNYGLQLLVWKGLNPFPREFSTLALEAPISLFSMCTIPAELRHLPWDA